MLLLIFKPIREEKMKQYKRRPLPFLAALLVLVFVAGCTGTPKKPEWVTKGSGAFKGKKGETFYGVGSVFGIKNPSLERTTADNRARAEIARVFKTYTAILMKDYQASTAAKDPKLSLEEQNVEQTIKTFTKAELTGVEIVDHWRIPETGEYFSLARMDLEMFKDYLKSSKVLSEAVRQRVIEHAEKAFRDLEKEETRHE